MALHTLKIVVVDGGRAENLRGYSSGESGVYGQSMSPIRSVVDRRTMQEKVASCFSPTATYGMVQVGRLAVQTAKSAFNYYVSDIGRSTGDSNYQAIVNRKMEVIGQTASLINGAISGAMAGGMTGNPIGVAVGAVVGLASSAINIGFQEAQAQRAYNHTMAEEKAARDYTIGRMTGGTGVRLR